MRGARLLAALVATLAAQATSTATAAAASPPVADCRAELSVPTIASSEVARDVTSDDLVQLRDIGRPDEQTGEEPLFSVAPDGRSIAFQIRRADPVANGYCLGIFVLDLAGGPPRAVDIGGELIRRTSRNADWAGLPNGVPALIRPAWSPDGARLAYLRRQDGLTQAWVVSKDGVAGHKVTDIDTDVEATGWAADGKTLLVTSRPTLPQAEAKIVSAASQGYLYDRRFSPPVAARPQVTGGLETRISALDPETGVLRLATAAEASKLDLTIGKPAEALRWARGSEDSQAWTYRLAEAEQLATGSRDPAARRTTTGLKVQTAAGWRATCALAICDKIVGVWIDAAVGRVVYLRREGWAARQSSLYSWRFGDAAPRRLLVTDEHIAGCDLAAPGLVCGWEAPTRPRRLVLIDPSSGVVTPLFDPNPEFANRRFGQVLPLQWANPEGYEAFGTLVLPPGRKADERVPLVVVQYEARGFLRGGTGDQYPVHALAAAGLAVLAISNPRSADGISAFASRTEIEASIRRNVQGWRERRNIHASLGAALATVFALKVVDPARVGISGMSDGAGTVQWALLNSHWFAAAAISNCCDDEASQLTASPLSTARMQRWGYPPPGRGASFFKPMSLVQNAARVDTPLLMQISDGEFIVALPTITALQAHDKPVEMYVYPDEPHVKWQPTHRAKIYERGLDWFNFWLRDAIDPNPAKTEQYSRWRALKSTLESTSAHDQARVQASALAKPSSSR